MTQDKELLLKDLCARLPYGVKISIPELWTSEKKIEVLNEIFKGDDGEFRCNDSGMLIKYVKPYLFPLSSMTESQNDSWRDAWFPDLMTSTDINYPESEKYLVSSHAKSLQWLYENHFDVNGLIPKGLAIDATGLNIY